MPKIETNDQGIVTSGRFVGRHIDEVMDYLEHLENAATGGDPNPPAGDPRPPADPSTVLAGKAAARVDGLQQLALQTAQRQEQDDEETFAASVEDYEEYRERITAMKKNAPPASRVMRGFHKQLYMFLKSQEPEVQARLFQKKEAAVPPAGDPAPPAPPPVSAVPATPKPKPVPAPAAVPTPTSRVEPEKKATLKANIRVEKMAAAAGMSTEKYLEQLESRGVTQEQIDSYQTATPQSARRKTVFDYAG